MTTAIVIVIDIEFAIAIELAIVIEIAIELLTSQSCLCTNHSVLSLP